MLNPSRQVVISLALTAVLCLTLGLATDVGLIRLEPRTSARALPRRRQHRAPPLPLEAKAGVSRRTRRAALALTSLLLLAPAAAAVDAGADTITARAANRRQRT
jgi:hypothetical protein